MPKINREELADAPWIIPPPIMQCEIADFLDSETAQIDTLIAKQEQLIESLRSRVRSGRELVLSHSIGRGDRLKWSITETDFRAGSNIEDLPLMSVSITWGVKLRDEVIVDQAASEDLSRYKVCRAGDIVVNRMRAFQGALGVASTDGMVSPDYATLRTSGNLDPEWAVATMRTQRFVGEMIKRLKGIGGTEGGNVRTPRINVDDLLDIQVDFPPISAQVEQTKLIANADQKVLHLIRRSEQFIALAKERRAALITAAVTGQVDVTKAA